MNIQSIPTNLLPYYIRMIGSDASITIRSTVANMDEGDVSVSDIKIPVRGILSFYKESEIDGVTIKSTDMQFIIVPDSSVSEGTIIDIQGTTRTVKNIEKIVADNTELAYILRLR